MEEIASSYKVRLTWDAADRGAQPHSSKIVEIAAATTVTDLHETAAALLGTTSAVRLTTGFPPKALNASSGMLVRAVVPAHSRIHCAVVRLPANAAVTKKRAREEKSPASSMIDLTEDTTDDEDEEDVALDRQVPKQKYATARPTVQSLPREGTRPLAALQDEDDEDPTTIDHTPWIWKRANNEKPLGKWLVFASEATVCSVWREIWPRVVSGALGACGAKVATKLCARINGGAGGSSYVICVYATAANMKEVGLKLIPMVQRNISFKQDAATAANKYSYNTHEKVTSLTLYWHRGRPTFTKPPSTMTATKSRRMAGSTAAKLAVTELTHSFEIVLTCVGLDRSAVSLETRQSWMTGTTSFTLHREPDNRFDPDHAIAVHLREEPGASPQKVGYILSNANPPQAKLLAPWMDRHLLRIDAAVLFRRVGASTMDLLVKGVSCPDASELLDTL